MTALALAQTLTLARSTRREWTGREWKIVATVIKRKVRRKGSPRQPASPKQQAQQ